MKHVNTKVLGGVLFTCFILTYLLTSKNQRLAEYPYVAATESISEKLSSVSVANDFVIEDNGNESKPYLMDQEDQTFDIPSASQSNAINIVNNSLQNITRDYSIGIAYIDVRNMCKSHTYLKTIDLTDYCRGVDFSENDRLLLDLLEKGFKSKNLLAGETLIEFWNSELSLLRQNRFASSVSPSAQEIATQNKIKQIYEQLYLFSPQAALDLKQRLGLIF